VEGGGRPCSILSRKKKKFPILLTGEEKTFSLKKRSTIHSSEKKPLRGERKEKKVPSQRKLLRVLKREEETGRKRATISGGELCLSTLKTKREREILQLLLTRGPYLSREEEALSYIEKVGDAKKGKEKKEFPACGGGAPFPRGKKKKRRFARREREKRKGSTPSPMQVFSTRRPGKKKTGLTKSGPISSKERKKNQEGSRMV